MTDKKNKKLKYKFIETAPCPYAPIGKGLAIVDIEMLQSAIHKTEKRIIEKIEELEPDKITGWDTHAQNGFDHAICKILSIISKEQT